MAKISQTADRALRVLEALADDPASPTELAKSLGLNRTVVHRLVQTLVSHDLVGSVDGKYHVGEGARTLARGVETALRRVVSDPVLQLALETRGTALLTLRSGDRAGILTSTSTDPHEELRITPDIGKFTSLLLSPHGLAMLAFSEPHVIKRARAEAPDAARFDALIEKTRARGWADQSIDPHGHPLPEIAAPIFHVSEYADAALAVIQPPGTVVDQFAEPLLRACALITNAFTPHQS